MKHNRTLVKLVAHECQSALFYVEGYGRHVEGITMHKEWEEFGGDIDPQPDHSGAEEHKEPLVNDARAK